MINDDKLEHIKTNRFTYRDVMELYQIKDYHILKAILEDWMELGKIAPVKKMGRTSFIPSVYFEYKKLLQKPDYSGYRSEIGTLNSRLNISGYLKSPEKYVENTKEIKILSDYLWNRSEALRLKMSVKERSYDIWGDEKFLESAKGRRICVWNQLDYEDLNCFYAPESFFYINLLESSLLDPTRQVTALILENKDPWYSLGKALKNAKQKLFLGRKIDVLIYGEGNKVTKPVAVREFMEDYIEGLSNKTYEVLYAGDIDVAGVDLLYACIRHNLVDIPDTKQQRRVISPFIPLYRHMISKLEIKWRNSDYSKDIIEYITRLPDTDDNRGRDYNREFLEFFTAEEKRLLEGILRHNKRIPQEILHYSDYIQMVE